MLWKPSFDGLERLAKLVQNGTIVCGIFAGALALLGNQYDRRVQRTLDMRKEYIETIRRDYVSLIDDWNENPDTPKVLTGTVAEQKAIVLAFFAVRSERTKLDNVIDFFDTLYFCIDNRACDRNTALYLFKPVARSVFEISAPYIAELRVRDRDAQFATGVEWLYRAQPQSLVRRYL
jgi:hypothetical protein